MVSTKLQTEFQVLFWTNLHKCVKDLQPINT